MASCFQTRFFVSSRQSRGTGDFNCLKPVRKCERGCEWLTSPTETNPPARADFLPA